MLKLKPMPLAWILSLSLCSLTASAQTWPNKPIKLITSAAPGGIVDIYARRHQPHLQSELGQPIMVENKPGASGAIAGDAAAKSDADGHTLFMGSQNELGLIGQLGVPVRYDPVKDFSVVGLTIAGYPILMVNSQLGIKTVPELVAHMKAKKYPRRLRWQRNSHRRTLCMRCVCRAHWHQNAICTLQVKRGSHDRCRFRTSSIGLGFLQ